MTSMERIPEELGECDKDNIHHTENYVVFFEGHYCGCGITAKAGSPGWMLAVKNGKLMKVPGRVEIIRKDKSLTHRTKR